jgi:hypothetical protein
LRKFTFLEDSTTSKGEKIMPTASETIIVSVVPIPPNASALDTPIVFNRMAENDTVPATASAAEVDGHAVEMANFQLAHVATPINRQPLGDRDPAIAELARILRTPSSEDVVTQPLQQLPVGAVAETVSLPNAATPPVEDAARPASPVPPAPHASMQISFEWLPSPLAEHSPIDDGEEFPTPPFAQPPTIFSPNADESDEEIALPTQPLQQLPVGTVAETVSSPNAATAAAADAASPASSPVAERGMLLNLLTGTGSSASSVNANDSLPEVIIKLIGKFIGYLMDENAAIPINGAFSGIRAEASTAPSAAQFVQNLIGAIGL